MADRKSSFWPDKNWRHDLKNEAGGQLLEFAIYAVCGLVGVAIISLIIGFNPLSCLLDWLTGFGLCGFILS